MTDQTLNSIDLRQLRALRAVVRTGSFHRAASQLGYTQSAISQQIKALEGHIGDQLLERTGTRTPAIPTRVGWIVLRHADAIFAQLEELGNDLAQLDHGVKGSVRIGFFQSVGATVLPRIVRQVAQQMPDVELVLHEAECDASLQAMVAIGDLDMTFAINALGEDVLDSTALFDDPTVLLTRADDPLAEGGTVAVSALWDRRIATFGASAHQRAVEDRLRHGDRSPVTIRSNDNATLAGVVASGSAVAVMSRLSVQDACGDGLVAVAVAGLPARTVSLARHRDRPLDPAATAVFELVVAECAGHSFPEPAPPARPSLRLLPGEAPRAAGE